MDHDQDEQWTVGRLRAALEHLAADVPVSVCLPRSDGTLVFAPLVDVGHDEQVGDDLPGLEFPLFGARDREEFTRVLEGGTAGLLFVDPPGPSYM